MRFQRNLAAFTLAAVAAACAHAQASWPQKNINVTVGFSAGGPTDVAARILAKELAKETGVNVIVESKAGASGAIASNGFIRQAADGHNLLVLVVPTVFKRIFDKEDKGLHPELAAVAKFYSHHNVLAVNTAYAQQHGIQNVADLVKYQQQFKAPIAFTSAGNGSIGHLAGQKMANMAGMEMQHISYKGAAPALNDTLAGQVPVMFGDYTTLLQHIQSNKLRPIAVASKERLKGLESTPTLLEQGFAGLTAIPWGGVVVHKNTDKAIKDQIESTVERIMKKPEVQQQIQAAGLIPDFQKGAVWEAQVNQEFAVWKKVVVDNKIQPE